MSYTNCLDFDEVAIRHPGDVTSSRVDYFGGPRMESDGTVSVYGM